MIAGSTFSGVGGLDLGLARAGFSHAFFAELDPWRRHVLAAHWPGIPAYDDVRAVARTDERCTDERAHLRHKHDRAEPTSADQRGARRDDLAIDLLAGGFPCQDVSVAGKRAGLAGARSGLFHEFARIADALRPAWLLIENVPGLLSSNDGRDFGVVLGTLADLGYGVAWRVLDARYFGVPQRRRRVFLVGHSGGDAAPALRALCESCDRHPTPRVCSWTRTPTRPRGSTQGPLARCLTSNERWDGADDNDAQARHLVAFHMLQDPISEAGGITPAMGRGTKTGTASIAISNPSGVRRLTPIECERLMSWPDGWTAPTGVRSPDSRRYAACGDGVVSNVAEWIGRGILDSLTKLGEGGPAGGETRPALHFPRKGDEQRPGSSR